MLTHQLAVTELGMKCSGGNGIQQPVFWPLQILKRDVRLRDNVLLETLKRSPEASCLAGGGTADYVGTGLLAVCKHH